MKLVDKLVVCLGVLNITLGSVVLVSQPAKGQTTTEQVKRFEQLHKEACDIANSYRITYKALYREFITLGTVSLDTLKKTEENFEYWSGTCDSSGVKLDVTRQLNEISP